MSGYIFFTFMLPMCETRCDRIRNDNIRWRVWVSVMPIIEKMAETRLRWFQHVERSPVNSVVRRVKRRSVNSIVRRVERRSVNFINFVVRRVD